MHGEPGLEGLVRELAIRNRFRAELHQAKCEELFSAENDPVSSLGIWLNAEAQDGPPEVDQSRVEHGGLRRVERTQRKNAGIGIPQGHPNGDRKSTRLNSSH